MKRSATVAKLPPGYEILRPAAEADNGCLCRHVRVRKSATLREAVSNAGGARPEGACGPPVVRRGGGL